MDAFALDRKAKASPAIVLLRPALAAIAYPFLLAAMAWLLRVFQVAPPPGSAAVTVTVLAILASAAAVMAVAFARAVSLGRIGAGLAYPVFAHP